MDILDILGPALISLGFAIIVFSVWTDIQDRLNNPFK